MPSFTPRSDDESRQVNVSGDNYGDIYVSPSQSSLNRTGVGSPQTPTAQPNPVQPQHIQQLPSKRRRAKIHEIGPAWITTILGLLVALTGMGVVVGRESASQVATPQTITVTAVGSAVTTIAAQPSGQTPMDGGAATSAASGATTQQVAEGVELVRCSVDVADGYTVPIERTSTCPGPSKYVSGFMFNGSNAYASGGTMAVATDDEPTYDSCKKNTRYASPLNVATGTTLCFHGHSVIASIAIREIKRDSGTYAAIDLVIWRGASA
ncbi:hypothetical protein ACIRRA_33730 [Nocardia sp. NPDC101769]|uniref:hypothetical protein n=1 Tax=Nocardia sp. NPDC101769 TaxID=3364333 RepID=UPI00382CF114